MLEETGERQVKENWIQVDPDHRMRYEFAASLIENGMDVADVGCGIGYGSYFMAAVTGCRSVLGLDIAAEAIGYAEAFYAHPKVTFAAADLLRDAACAARKFDLVTLFEVVEHVADAEAFLAAAAGLLKEDGVLILSTPNEAVLPFQKERFRFHRRHYTRTELETAVGAAGLEAVCRFSQNGGAIYGFPGGAMHLFVCRRRGSSVLPRCGAAAADTPFHRIMERWERADWLLDHVPQERIGRLAMQLEQARLEEGTLWRELVDRRDAYVRKYEPQICCDNPEFTGVLGPLEAGTELVQRLPCAGGRLCAVSVLPALYQTAFRGLLTAALYQEEGGLAAFQTFDGLRDNQELSLRFAPVADSAGKTFRLELFVSDLERGSMLTFYTTEPRGGAGLWKDGLPQEKTLTYRLIYV